jgi:cell division transport system permease protein
MFSIASLVTMTACIFLFGIFFSILLNVNAAVKYYEEDVGISVFFNEGITQDQIDRIGEQIKARPEVSEITYTSAEEAWQKFQQIYFPDDPDAAASFVKGNPLANDASYTITTANVEDQPTLVAYIKTLDGVRKVNQSDEVVRTLSGFNTLMTYVSIAIITVLLVVAIILISNTVNVGISVRKNEIGIMKLIGATDSFVRAPFIVEGLMLGLIGSIIPLIILYFTYNWLLNKIVTKFSVLNSLSNILLSVNDVYRYLIPVSLILGIGIGLAGSIITVRKHLRV